MPKGQGSSGSGSDKSFLVHSTGYMYKLCGDSILKIYLESSLICQNAVWHKKIHIKELISWHGVKSLFKHNLFTISNNTSISSVFERFNNIMRDLDQEQAHKYTKIIKDAGMVLVDIPTPWIEREDIMFYRNDFTFVDKIRFLDSDILFTLFIYLSIRGESDDEFVKHASEQISHGFFSLVIARFKPSLMSKVQETLDQCHFSAKQQRFIWRWVRKEINLVVDE